MTCSYTEVETYTDVFKLLQSGKADAGVVNRNFGTDNSNKFDVVKTPIVFQPIDVLFAFPKSAHITPHLIRTIDLNLKKLKNDKNSIYSRLIQKYIEKEIEPAIPKWIKPVLLAVGVSLFLLFIVAVTARYHAAMMTAKLRKELTIRKKAEKNLNESEKRYRAIAEDMPVLICCFKADGEITYVNESYCRYFEQRPE